MVNSSSVESLHNVIHRVRRAVSNVCKTRHDVARCGRDYAPERPAHCTTIKKHLTHCLSPPAGFVFERVARAVYRFDGHVRLIAIGSLDVTRADRDSANVSRAARDFLFRNYCLSSPMGVAARADQDCSKKLSPTEECEESMVKSIPKGVDRCRILRSCFTPRA